VAETVDARLLKSRALQRVGSSPTTRIFIAPAGAVPGPDAFQAAGDLRFLTMRARSEEEPDPEEEPSPETPASATATMVPAVSTPGREFEYRTQLVTAAEVVDGSTLAEQLTKASAEGWDLVEIIGAGDRHAILLRRPKDQNRESRPVGFLPPGR
jgi:hypothetical protein